MAENHMLACALCEKYTPYIIVRGKLRGTVRGRGGGYNYSYIIVNGGIAHQGIMSVPSS